MKITDIKIFPVDEPKLKAFVSIIFEHCFIVSDIKVIEGTRGLFLSMPSKKRRDGTFKDIAHPLNASTRKMIEDDVIAAYHEEMKKSPRPASAVDAAEQMTEGPAEQVAESPAEPTAEVEEAAEVAPEPPPDGAV